jgi:sterol desaturase/sphingolipid hydroxylase (fatty acid hydroxylase superfamily)
LILQALVATMVCYIFPFLQHLPIWNVKGLIVALILHVGVSEPLYYLVHKKFHEDYLFKNYHSLHHSSHVPTPLTGEFFN